MRINFAWGCVSESFALESASQPLTLSPAIGFPIMICLVQLLDALGHCTDGFLKHSLLFSEGRITDPGGLKWMDP